MKRKSSQGPHMKKGQAGAHVDVLQQKSLNIEITPLLCLLRHRLLNSFSVLESLLTPTLVTQGSLQLLKCAFCLFIHLEAFFTFTNLLSSFAFSMWHYFLNDTRSRLLKCCFSTNYESSRQFHIKKTFLSLSFVQKNMLNIRHPQVSVRLPQGKRWICRSKLEISITISAFK